MQTLIGTKEPQKTTPKPTKKGKLTMAMQNDKSTFSFFQSGTGAAKTGMMKATAPGASYEALRMLCVSVSHALMKDYAEKEAQKSEWAKVYNRNKLFEMSRDADSVYADEVKTKQRFLNGIIDKLKSSREEAVNRFMTIPPRQEKILMINTVEPRLEDMSKTELNALIASVSDNYQESAYLNAKCKQHGIDYQIMDPERMLEDLDNFTAILKNDVVAHIGEDPSGHLRIAEFFKGGTDGVLNIYQRQLDSIAPALTTMEALPELTDSDDLLNRLTAARRKVYGKDEDLRSQIISVQYKIEKYGLSENHLHEAEKLIATVNEQYPDKNNGDDAE